MVILGEIIGKMVESLVRQTAIEKFTKDISPKDYRVAVSGIVISNGNGLILDDGTGQVGVLNSNNGFKEGDYIRVIGKVIPSTPYHYVDAEIIQDLNRMNKQLHQKVIGRLR